MDRRTLVFIGVFVLTIVSVGLLAGLLRQPCHHEPVARGGVASLQTGLPWTNHRLPHNLIPDHYDLQLFPDFYNDHSVFYGNVSIRLNVTIATNFVLVHIKDMNITRTELKVNGQSQDIVKAFHYSPNEYWVVENSVPIEAGSIVDLGMSFHGSLLNGLVGLYRSTYLNSETGQRRCVIHFLSCIGDLDNAKTKPTYRYDCLYFQFGLWLLNNDIEIIRDCIRIRMPI
jgi:hypothetical protein